MQDFTYINKELGTDYNSNKEIDWYAVSTNFKLSESFIEKFKDKLNWGILIQNQILSERFIEFYKYKIDFRYIAIYQKLSEEFIEKYQDELKWDYVSAYQVLSEPFIEKYQDKVDWIYISMYQKLSVAFIEKHLSKVKLKLIFQYQKLSEEDIERLIERELSLIWVSMFKSETSLSSENSQPIVNEFILNYLHTIAIYQKVSDKFLSSYNLIVSKNSFWQYKDAEFKKDKVISTNLYECHDDYFIAYKAIRNDRYSLYNFQYQYLPGGTYESACDCTNSEDSFGLNVGTYEFAKNYLGTKFGIIVKCKISYEDIGRIVHNGEKIRCFKITVLE